MPPKQKAARVALIISALYVGLGSIQLWSVFNMTNFIFQMEWFDLLITPAYIIGFVFGFSGGSLWASIGQLLTFAVAFGILYLIFLLFYKIQKNKK